MGGQAPANLSRNIEVLPLPLGGNHGHARLVATANEVVATYSRDGVISLAGDEDVIERWIVVDHDDMEKYGVTPEQLREEAQSAGFTLIINKPNFEFFVLAVLSDLDTALTTSKEQFKSKINTLIKSLNESDESQKGFSKEMFMPKYSKKRHVAEKLFGRMLGYHPELIEKMNSLEVNTRAEKYSEMPRVTQRITELYKGTSDVE